MNELKIPERIDEVLTILNSIPLRGYDQWNPAVEAMKRLAAISRDVQQLGKDGEKEAGADA